MSDQPWKDMPTPLTDASSEHVNNTYNDWVCAPGSAVDVVTDMQVSRAIEQRMRAAEALLLSLTFVVRENAIPRSLEAIDAHLAAAKEMDGAK